MREKVYGDQIWDDFHNFETQRAVVWVDPLDGTMEFVSQNPEGVAV
jgi:3'-phosphoadenosine 5'-phosphosulfate (PAPS) 3'-phosphatase